MAISKALPMYPAISWIQGHKVGLFVPEYAKKKIAEADNCQTRLVFSGYQYILNM